MAKIEVHAVTRNRWDDMAKLFVTPGPRGGRPATAWCWCMWWRERSHDPKVTRPAMRKIVKEDRQPGVLAYLDGTPVGWISIAPREEFGQLLSSRALKPKDQDEQGVFSIVCFYIHPTARKQGVGTALLKKAVKEAARRGANVVEAYPSSRTTGYMGDNYMGPKSLYLSNGFEDVAKAGARRVVRYLL